MSGMIVHLGLFSGIKLLKEEVTIFLAQQNIILTASEITTSQGLRPGGVAYDVKDKQRVFLEFTRFMESVSFSDKRD